MTGKKISHYEVGRKLGEGGMGAVFEAHDTSLNRTVAVKVLASDMERTPESHRRLLREARTAAALNHPNICTIHDVVESDGQTALVMEYVAGKTLREIVAERPLALAKALDIALQMAAAVKAAHDRGIVHRDIKSSNVMLTPAGQAKILDFGLAYGADQETLSAASITAGTPQYMSPEQVEGKCADFRTDVWSLGVVLFEMVTGKVPFESDSRQGLYQQILEVDPEPLTALRTGVPIDLDRIVAKALAKDPKCRYQHVEDLAVDLQSVANQLSSEREKRRTASAPSLPVAESPKPMWRKAVPWAVVVVLTLVAGGSAWMAYTNWSGGKKTMRFISRLPGDQTFTGVDFFGSAITIARAGDSIVYVAREGKSAQLWRREIGEEQAYPIAGTTDGVAPFLSPDKRWVGFVDGKALKRIGFQGGSAQQVSDSPADSLFGADIAFFGATWSPSGDPIIAGECTRGLRRFRLATRKKENLTDILGRSQFRQQQFPQVLPDGRHVLFTSWSGEEDSSIAVFDQETNAEKTIISPGTYARYVPTGHLVYAWKNNLYVAPFDPKGLQVTGPSALAVHGVLMNMVRGAAHYDVSENGTLVYIPGEAITTFRQMGWVDGFGKVTPVGEALHLMPQALRLSADGSTILTMRRSPQTGLPSVGTYDPTRKVWREISAESGGNYWPVWFPDGRSVLFNGITRVSEESYSVRIKALNAGLTTAVGPPSPSGHQQPASVSPDGRFLLYQQWSKDMQRCDLVSIPLSTGGKPIPFVATGGRAVQGEFSPDGKWVAFAISEAGKLSVRVKAFPAGKEMHQVSSEPGWEPIWARDGKSIFYRSRDGRRIFAVAFSASPAVSIGTPRLVVEGQFEPGNGFGRTYDASPDGSRFLVWLRESAKLPEPREYHVILNWGEELKRIAPPGN